MAEYPSRYDAFKTSFAAKDLPQGSYYAASGGQAMTNAPALASPFTLPDRQAEPDFTGAVSAPQPGYTSPQAQVVPREQLQNPTGGYPSRPNVNPEAIYAGVSNPLRGTMQAETARDPSIDPLQQGMSTMEAMKRGIAQRGEGSASDRKKALAPVAQEAALKQAQDEDIRKQQAMQSVDKRKITLARDIAGAQAEAKLGPKLQEMAQAQQYKREYQSAKFNNTLTLDQIKGQRNSLEKQLDRASKEGMADEANALKRELADVRIDADMKKLESEGKVIGTEDWLKSRQAKVDDTIAEMKASKQLSNEQEVNQFKAKAALYAAEAIMKNDLTGKTTLQQAASQVEGMQASGQLTEKPIGGPGPAIKMKPEEIESAKKFNSLFKNEADAKERLAKDPEALTQYMVNQEILKIVKAKEKSLYQQQAEMKLYGKVLE